MPQGDRRGSTYEFYDWTYDGEWRGDILLNGLGSLTDGSFGPENFKLAYYAKNRGWVGWKSNSDPADPMAAPDNTEKVEVVFEFDRVREFREVDIFTNNQFMRDVGVFREVRIFFSIGGDLYNSEPVYHLPMEDSIFEEPRNVTVKLHRRVGRFVKLQMFYRNKWILISEVSFASSPARGNYTPESFSDVPTSTAPSEVLVVDVQQDSNNVVVDTETKETSGNPYMPVIVGVLTAVILLLAAIIFFIVSRTRQRKQWMNVQLNADGTLPAEKIALNANEFQFNYDKTGLPSDTGSSGGSRASGGRVPKLDDNYNTPMLATPRSMRASTALYAVTSRNGSVRSQATPLGGRKTLPPPPLPRLPNEVVYTEPGMYAEPYRALRYSPYYGYGPVLSEIEDSLMKQSLLSDGSCGDYAVPLPRHPPPTEPPPHALIASSFSPSVLRKERANSASSVEQQSEYSDIGKPCGTLPGSMRSRMASHLVPELTSRSLSLRQRLSEGAFGTVFVADAMGLPEYGGKETAKRLVAVKFLTDTATEHEKTEFIHEVRLLSVLEDPNISRVLGVCSTEDPFFVAMEYLEHGDLNQFLRCHLPEGSTVAPGTRTLSFGTLVYMASQVASGMRYLERLNFVHRDLATRNCLVGKSYHIKICDFGSDNPAYRRDYFEMDNHLLIPIRWMAWESVLLCKYTTKSDVWSFAVCLWEILQLASVRPYETRTDDEVLLDLRCLQTTPGGQHRTVLERPPLCPKDLYELMCECWKRDDASRPTFREIHLFLQRKNLGYSPI